MVPHPLLRTKELEFDVNLTDSGVSTSTFISGPDIEQVGCVSIVNDIGVSEKTS